MKLQWTGFVGAAALAMTATAAGAAVQYDADLAAPGVYYGSGNANGHFTIETVDGVELGLRAKVRGQNPDSPGADNIYDFALGKEINFDWSFNPGADGSQRIDSYISTITITNLGTGGSLSFPASIFSGYTDPGAPGGYQQSWFLGFGFLNGGGLSLGDIDYDMNVDSTYRIDWSVTASTSGFSASNSILINQGAGAVVPEPGMWALMILGFGAAGAALRRRRLVWA